MDRKHLILRNASYAAGREHDQALIECSDLLMQGDYDKAKRAVDNHTKVANKYGTSLAQLGLYLAGLEQTPEIHDEGRRVQRLLDLLDKEVENVSHRLELLKTAINRAT